MSDYDRNASARWTAGVGARAGIDQGLRSYMLSVYNYMALGLAITGFFALGAYMVSVTGDPTHAAHINGAVAQIGAGTYLTQIGYGLFVSPLKWVIVLAPLGLVFYLSARISSMSVSGAQIAFWLFAALMGLSLSTIFLVYTQASIARVFFITAASFGALSLYGYTTKRDMSGMGSFLFMGLIGIIIASLVNIFLHSTALQFVVSVVGVLIFAGLTAYDTQRIKEMYSAGDGTLVMGRKAIMGALSLYLDFINLFMMLLRLFGLIIASLVNLFLQSPMLQFVYSVIGVLIFAGLTAWDTQRLKNDYIYGYASQGGDIAERAAITGALSLYLNFINLFTLLLQLLGQRD
jgi:FtsH-binding integral membrane protein